MGLVRKDSSTTQRETLFNHHYTNVAEAKILKPKPCLAEKNTKTHTVPGQLGNTRSLPTPLCKFTLGNNRGLD